MTRRILLTSVVLALTGCHGPAHQPVQVTHIDREAPEVSPGNGPENTQAGQHPPTVAGGERDGRQPCKSGAGRAEGEDRESQCERAAEHASGSDGPGGR